MRSKNLKSCSYLAIQRIVEKPRTQCYTQCYTHLNFLVRICRKYI